MSITTNHVSLIMRPPAWMDAFRRFRPQPSSTVRETAKILEAVRNETLSFREYSDETLACLVANYRNREGTEEVTVAGLAAACEAVRRVLSVEPYDCQILGALSLVRGNIAQMQTGEGKTLVAMMAAVCFAFNGRLTHVMTVNNYLARRDFEQLQPVYQILGISAGCIDHGASVDEKKRAYRCEIVYGPGYEFGFDYLRDQRANESRPTASLGDRVRNRWRNDTTQENASIQSRLDVAIVDEADSVLLDEAGTPLVLSASQASPAKNPEVYRHAHEVAKSFLVGIDYELSSHENDFQWTAEGKTKWKQPPPSICDGLERSWTQYLQQAIIASHCFRRDVHYLIDEERIRLIDQHTGRILQDRSWGDGLQQAVEAKEGLAISEENQALATITRQRLMRRYAHLSGLTGTTQGSEAELHELYGLAVDIIPPHRPNRIDVRQARIFLNQRLHEEAIIDSVKACLDTGRPVLVGTTSVQSSERLSNAFTQSRISHQLLSGRQDADEAAIIAIAGQSKAVTIATNIAGRGTDIRLGPGVAERGGLHVLATELFTSMRVERQLMGRAGRQGDLGSFELLISAQDPLLIQYSPHLAHQLRVAIQNRRIEAMKWLDDIRELQTQLEHRCTEERRMMFSQEARQEAMAREFA